MNDGEKRNTALNAVVAGVAITRFGMFTGIPLRQLAAEAADRALDESGLRADEVGLVVFGNAAAGLLTGQEMIRGQVSLGASRLAGRPLINVENACASSSSAFHVACLAVTAGTYEAVVVVGAEKMTSRDRSLAPRALATAIDVERTQHAGRPEAGEPANTPRPVFMEIYAEQARDYLERTAATPRDFAAVASKATRNGSRNPVAQVSSSLTVDEVLAARTVVAPLTRPMCSSIGDGAAAVVVCSPGLAARRGLRGARVLASVVGSGRTEGPDDLVERTATAAYQQAGVGPGDINLVELHDAAASAEPIVCEELGLADPGEGVKLVRDGVTDVEGACPVNPSGGLLARGHAIGATGLAQLGELVDQLQDRAGPRQLDHPRIGLAENAGGHLSPGPAACVVTILARG